MACAWHVSGGEPLGNVRARRPRTPPPAARPPAPAPSPHPPPPPHPHPHPTPRAQPVGASGLRRVAALEAADAIRQGEAALRDFLLLSGIVAFADAELRGMLGSGELGVVDDPRALWDEVWSLADAHAVETEVYSEGGASLSDGTAIWWTATQLGRAAQTAEDGGRAAQTVEDGGRAAQTVAGRGGSSPATDDGGGADDDEGSFDALLAGLQAMPPSGLADEALDEWLKFFAGHKKRE